MSKDYHDFKQLYDKDQYRKSAEVEITYVEELEKPDPGTGAKYKALTTETVFYPEGGGQPGDTGTITDQETGKSVKVLDTRYDFKASDKEQEEPGIFHFLDAPLEPGTKVLEEIDWYRRFTHSQQHSSEHILSGLVHEKYGYMNVGFHLGQEITTIDFDGPLSYEEMQEIVAEANRVIWSNKEISINVYTAEEAKDIEYRSKIELDNLVRLITIPGADTCACCGTHVKRTGDIGMILCTNTEAYKGGTRITFVAGTRAFKLVRERQEMLNILVQKLNLPAYDLVKGVDRLDDKVNELEQTIMDIAKSLWNKAVANFAEQNLLLITEEIFDNKTLKYLMKSYTEEANLLVLMENKGNYTFFLHETEDSYKSENSWFKYIKSNYNARGGGKPEMIQGQIKGESINDKHESLAEFLQELSSTLNAKLQVI